MILTWGLPKNNCPLRHQINCHAIYIIMYLDHTTRWYSCTEIEISKIQLVSALVAISQMPKRNLIWCNEPMKTIWFTLNIDKNLWMHVKEKWQFRFSDTLVLNSHKKICSMSSVVFRFTLHCCNQLCRGTTSSRLHARLHIAFVNSDDTSEWKCKMDHLPLSATIKINTKMILGVQIYRN